MICVTEKLGSLYKLLGQDSLLICGVQFEDIS